MSSLETGNCVHIRSEPERPKMEGIGMRSGMLENCFSNTYFYSIMKYKIFGFKSYYGRDGLV
jgi:hypothetical protein